MIPNLNDLPPLVVDEESRLKPLLFRCAIFALMLAMVGGIVWFYTKGIRQASLTEMSSVANLGDIAARLWPLGTTPEVRFVDPDLTREIKRLHSSVTARPDIIVVPAEAGSGASYSHEILFLRGKITIITIRVFYDDAGNSVDLLSFRTAPEFAAEPFP